MKEKRERPSVTLLLSSQNAVSLVGEQVAEDPVRVACAVEPADVEGPVPLRPGRPAAGPAARGRPVGGAAAAALAGRAP